MPRTKKPVGLPIRARSRPFCCHSAQTENFAKSDRPPLEFDFPRLHRWIAASPKLVFAHGAASFFKSRSEVQTLPTCASTAAEAVWEFQDSFARKGEVAPFHSTQMIELLNRGSRFLKTAVLTNLLHLNSYEVLESCEDFHVVLNSLIEIHFSGIVLRTWAGLSWQGYDEWQNWYGCSQPL